MFLPFGWKGEERLELMLWEWQQALQGEVIPEGTLGKAGYLSRLEP